MWDEDGGDLLDYLEYKSVEDLQKMLHELKNRRHHRLFIMWMLLAILPFAALLVLHFGLTHSWPLVLESTGSLAILCVTYFFLFSLGSSTESRIEDILQRTKQGEKRWIVPWLQER